MVPADAATAAAAAGDLPSSLVQRADGVYFKAEAPAASLQGAANQVFLSGACFRGLDYGVFIRALYGAGPELPDGMKGQPLWRFADAIVAFPAARRELYKSVRIVGGEAEYYFEPVFIDVVGIPPVPAQLDFGEFVADLWSKGVRFGIDAAVVREAIASRKVARLVVARKLPAAPGRDAAIVEVSESIHRSNAPRLLANGRFDMHTFQNRFPQVKAGMRLLRREPPAPGTRGFELSGILLEPPAARDVELVSVAGEGTLVEHHDGIDYLVSSTEGFINVDSKSQRISIGPKIISREGVSARTTGNLKLDGDYEEFGEIQEQRTVEGGNITVHADVFGNISSRGGTIALQKNLMGGSASNADGDIRVAGVASGALLQAKQGEVVLGKAQNCVITGTRVVITEAYNCEIMAEEVLIKLAAGCAIAARRIEIDSAGPRKQAEMQLHVMVPDTAKYDEKLAECAARAGKHEQQAERCKAQMDSITAEQEIRNYLQLASKVRKQEVTLNQEQLVLFQKMAQKVGPSLKMVARLQVQMKEAQAAQQKEQELGEHVYRQKLAVMGSARCTVRQVAGDMVVRTLVFNPDLGPAYLLPPKEVKLRVRAPLGQQQPLFVGSAGMIDWSAGAA
ncbi:flagellar assembly protein A [Pseudoduganella violaceinigra]|uniref:flagellar assembly protein A n=1 Tax=Pseudoduganella violaceinigra TaxID=246602 RepID=UPI000686ED4F|nr:flagellar assembly protein A [Pseudoduganella violaceinigra]